MVIQANGGLSVQVDSKADFIIVNPYKESTYDTLVYALYPPKEEKVIPAD